MLSRDPSMVQGYGSHSRSLMSSFAYRRYVHQRKQPDLVSFFFVTVVSDPVADFMYLAALVSSFVDLPYAHVIFWGALCCFSLEATKACYDIYQIKAGVKKNVQSWDRERRR